MAEATELNFDEAFLPRSVTAAMQTTAMRATRRAYSTSDAPRSLWMLNLAMIQALRYSNDVATMMGPFVSSSTAPDPQQ